MHSCLLGFFLRSIGFLSIVKASIGVCSTLEKLQSTILESDNRQQQALQSMRLEILEELEKRSVHKLQHKEVASRKPPPLRDRYESVCLPKTLRYDSFIICTCDRLEACHHT